jgi:hypothetical protein
MSSVEHPLGALELATFRRGPFICLSGFHEVALGDAPVYDQGERGRKRKKKEMKPFFCPLLDRDPNLFLSSPFFFSRWKYIIKK